MSDEPQVNPGRGASRQAGRADRSVPGDVLLVLRIVHAALIASILLFGVMLMFVIRPPGEAVVGADIPVRADPPAYFAAIMIAMAAASMLAIYMVRRRMSRDRAAAAATTPEHAARNRSRLYSASIASWALCESIALYGLVLGIVHRDTGPFLPFAAVALVLLVALAPRRSHIL